jgi:hypothetical protein
LPMICGKLTWRFTRTKASAVKLVMLWGSTLPETVTTPPDGEFGLSGSPR